MHLVCTLLKLSFWHTVPRPHLWNLTPPPPARTSPTKNLSEPNVGSVQAHKEVNLFKQKRGELNRTYGDLPNRTEPLNRSY